MRFLKFLILGFFAIGLLLPYSSLAVESSYASRSEQYYSVVFDNEQEAAVVAKLSYTNLSQDEIENLALEIPGQKTRIISIIQQDEADNCIEDNQGYYGQENCQKTFVLLERDKSKDQQTTQSLKIEIPLKKSVEPMDSGTIILYYKSQGFTEKVWNGYKFAFETIKSNYDIDNVRVAIDVADDLYIKETATGQTNYQSDLSVMPALGSQEFKASSSLERVSTSISTATGVVKETSSLDPGENFTVEGKYYNSSWLGQLPTIVGVGVTFLIIMVVLIVIIKNEKKQ